MYTRNCPKCNIKLHYENKYHFARAEQQGRTCMSCRSKGKPQRPEWIKKRIPRGKGHYRYGKSYTKSESRMMGKSISKSWTDESVRNHHLEGMAKSFGFSSYNEYKMSLPKFRRFKLDVRRVTKHQPVEELKNFDKRGRAGVCGAYHLDHIISIYEGFKRGMSAEQIGSIDNLRMIKWEENLKKGPR